jgi:hypothetical protein
MEIIVGQTLNETIAISTRVEHNNKSYFFPEPNPVHLFFSNATEHFEIANQLKNDLWKLKSNEYHKLFNSFNAFFNEITTGIIMLYTSVEAFINQHIPENYTFIIDNKPQTKNDIEWMDIKEKIKDYLPIIFGIKFQITNEKDYQNILKVRQIRNDLIHLKTQLTINKTFYEKLFSELIETKTGDLVDSVFIFMNTFRQDYLIENKN